MNRRLFVGNLPFTTTEQELRDLFGEAGSVESARIITDRDTGKSRGFGFVEMATDREAATAIDQLDGAQLGSRILKVSEAQEPQRRSSGRGDRREPARAPRW